jgi:hypothetical protein
MRSVQPARCCLREGVRAQNRALCFCGELVPEIARPLTRQRQHLICSRAIDNQARSQEPCRCSNILPVTIDKAHWLVIIASDVSCHEVVVKVLWTLSYRAGTGDCPLPHLLAPKLRYTVASYAFHVELTPAVVNRYRGKR